jgi:hypothetical protein
MAVLSFSCSLSLAILLLIIQELGRKGEKLKILAVNKLLESSAGKGSM